MYIDINTLFTFEVSKSDDQSILAAIVPRSYFKPVRAIKDNFLHLYLKQLFCNI
jgi:hypothetical protein